MLATQPRKVFTPEHEQFRKTVKRFFRDEVEPHIKEWEKAGAFDPAIFRKAGQYGLLQAGIPTEYGGMGGDFMHHAILHEEHGYSLGGASMGGGFGTDGSSYLIYAGGTEQQKKDWLPRYASGELIAEVCFTEPHCGSDLGAIRTVAKQSGGDYIINGSKMFISNGPIADFIIVLCQTDLTIEPSHRGQSILIVEKGRPGFTAADVGEKMGNKMTPTGELSFNDVRVPISNLVGKEGQGFYQALRILEEIRVEIAAQALGIAQGAFDRALAYVKQRKQFGRKLIDFQATRHRLSELITRIETARLIVYKAACAIDRDDIDPMLTSMAKMYAARVAVEVADEAIQLHGGYGYMLEYEVERFSSDARLMGIFGGTTEVQKNTIAQGLIM